MEDQGSQFTSGSFQALLRKYGAVSSIGRRGNPYDNALMESFYKTKKERAYWVCKIRNSLNCSARNI
jgi:transposase InsO family protein